MHPIERLRYVARVSGVEQGVLVRETASALASLGFDPAGLVTACRRVIERHPASGPLWYLSARVLTANDPRAESWEVVEEILSDPTGIELAYALGDGARVAVLGWPELVGEALPRRGDLDVLVIDALGEGSGLVRRLRYSEVAAEDVPVSGLGAAVVASDVVLLEASAVGPDGFIGIAGSRAAAAVARHAGVPVWLVAGAGRLLPKPMWQALRAHVADDSPWEADDELVPLDLVDRIATTTGVVSVEDALAATACPTAPELFKSLR